MTSRLVAGRRGILASAGLVLTSIAVGLLVAEAIARLLGAGAQFGELFSLDQAPHHAVGDVVLWSDPHPRTTADDLRRAATADGTFTLVGLGDSIMYGVQLTKEQTYLEQARRVLAERSPRQMEMLNLAVPGYNTAQENAVHRELDQRIKPNLVVVHYWENDAQQFSVVGRYVVDIGDLSADGSRIRQPLPLPPAAGDFLLRHSRLYDVLTQVVLGLTRQPQPQDWNNVARPLAEIDARTRAAGGRLLVLASPKLDQSEARPTADLAQLRRFTSERGIEMIDLSEWLRGVDAATVRQDLCHLNAEGHRIIGEHLADYLLQHDLKP